jgi:DNA repair protein RecO (recombination protein O)
MSAAGRVDAQPGFVLHAHAFRETSQIVECFTRDHGRVALVARGARRPRSQFRGVLLEFQPLELSWFGKGELHTLSAAEWQGGLPLLGGQALLYGYYVNELLLRLLPREDPHAGLYRSYALALAQLAHGPPNPALLRRFELALLRDLGYGLSLDRAADTGLPLAADSMYAYQFERGLVGAEAGPADSPRLSGRVLLAMARDDFADPQTLQQSKLLMRHLINRYLGNQPLHSRRVFIELQEL